MKLALLLLSSCGVSSLQLPLGVRPTLPHAARDAAALAALSLPVHAAVADDFWVEVNKPPITFNPLTINPVGYVFLAAYAAYVAYSILKPPDEAAIALAEKANAAAAVAAAAQPGFLKAAAEAEGAVVKPSGLVYRELSAGSGAAPTAEDSVLVHYIGTLHDGVTFDSSRARGEPITFPVGQVIKGWQEGLQLMKVGGTAVLTVPAALAYGPASMPGIPGSSALQFEVELLEIVPAEEKKGVFGLF